MSRQLSPVITRNGYYREEAYMHPYLADLDSIQLAQVYDANKSALAARMGQLPGAVSITLAGVTVIDADSPLATFNGVEQANLAEDDAPTAITRIQTYFRARQRPFHWTVGLTSQPANLGALLEAQGIAFDEAEPAMVADLDAMPETTASVGNLAIIPVTSLAQVDQWVATWGCGAPQWVTDAWQAIYRGLWQQVGADELALFLALRDNEPVGTVYIYMHSGVAAVHYVVTLPTFRRQGIGAALTLHAMRAARDHGYHVAILSASPFGINIYRRLGFRECGEIRTYAWEP
jgi:ribosomal protein S18 acetylase RimI-like enzyme